MSTVCASEFGGPNDPSTGHTGYRGDDLRGRMAFAELNMGTALGGLPHGAKLQITYGGKSVVAEKLDIGLGGSGCGGHSRAIDLWWETARALGFSGLAPVDVSGATGATTSPLSGKTKEAVFGIPGTPEIPGEQFLIPGGASPFTFFSFLSKFPEILKDFLKVLQLVSTREGWIRIGKVLIGLSLLAVGILGMANIEAVDTAKRAAVKGGEVAALVK